MRSCGGPRAAAPPAARRAAVPLATSRKATNATCRRDSCARAAAEGALDAVAAEDALDVVAAEEAPAAPEDVLGLESDAPRGIDAFDRQVIPLTKYETLIVLRPTLMDEERDQELARFESFLHGEECSNVKATVRGRHRMAYPIKGNWEGIYVLFHYTALPMIAGKVQRLLSTPVSGREDTILRHLTMKY